LTTYLSWALTYLTYNSRLAQRGDPENQMNQSLLRFYDRRISNFNPQRFFAFDWAATHFARVVNIKGKVREFFKTAKSNYYWVLKSKVDACDKSGMTALHNASIASNATDAVHLIDHGADLKRLNPTAATIRHLIWQPITQRTPRFSSCSWQKWR
jgi:ankyrin repeat protein